VSEKWEARAKGLAREVRGWSSCLRDKVGAVVIDPEAWDVVSTGFNDTAPGLPNCDAGGCPRAFRDSPSGSPYLDDEECLHAEDNALQRAGTRARGAWLVVTRAPCGNCQRRAKTAGIARIIIDSQETHQ
jgi:deoxycytidylate deaminase